MDRIEKALQKLVPKEKKWVGEIMERLSSGKVSGLDIKKLKGREDVFRIRKGNIRIIYRIDANNKILVLSIERRKENTYKI